MNIIYKYTISFFLIVFIAFSCVPAEVETEDTQESVHEEEVKENDTGNKPEIEEGDFLRKYFKFAEYLEETVDTIELDEEGKIIREKYFELLSVPENVYELDYDFELVKRIEIDTEDGLGDWFHENASEDYPSLNFVTENGDLCFNASGIYNASKYLVNKDKWIRYDTGVCPEFIPIIDSLHTKQHNKKIKKVF